MKEINNLLKKENFDSMKMDSSFLTKLKNIPKKEKNNNIMTNISNNILYKSIGSLSFLIIFGLFIFNLNHLTSDNPETKVITSTIEKGNDGNNTNELLTNVNTNINTDYDKVDGDIIDNQIAMNDINIETKELVKIKMQDKEIKDVEKSYLINTYVDPF